MAKIYSVSRGLTTAKKRVMALVKVDFSVFPGETLGIVGESGCGKSTLGRIIVKLDSPTSGRLTFMGRDITHLEGEQLKSYRRRVQIVFQDPSSALNPRKTVGYILEEPLVVHKWGNRMDRAHRVREMLEQVGLEEQYGRRFPHELSGGQRQRVVIARALVMAPQLIVADEPVSALDVSIQAQILNLLKDLQDTYRLTYLFISHDLNVVRFMSDRIAVMYRGQIVELGEADMIYEHPYHPYTIALISAVPTVKRRRRTRHAAIVEGEISPGTVTGCAFYSRCPRRCPDGAMMRPPLNEEERGHLVACFKAQ